MIRADCHRDATSIPAAEWDALAGSTEGHAYLEAVAHASLPGFRMMWFSVREDERLVLVVPGFVTDYRLDTTLDGEWRRIADRVAHWFPRLLSVRLLSLGSPATEHCRLAMAAGADPGRQARWLDAVIGCLLDTARLEGCGLVAAKDLPGGQTTAQEALSRAGLRPQPGLPTARLALPYATFDDYLASLSAATRKDLRRKLARSDALTIERVGQLDERRLALVMALYRQTLERSQLRFEELTPAFFRGVLESLPGRAHCVLYWLGERLLAFNLLLAEPGRLIDKYFGSDGDEARRWNMYFVSWAENVRYCIAHGIGEYQSGQSVYHDKVRLGSRLAANDLWYRHRNTAVDRCLALIERRFRLDRADPDLARLLHEYGA